MTLSPGCFSLNDFLLYVFSLFLMEPCVGLQCVVMALSGHIRLIFGTIWRYFGTGLRLHQLPEIYPGIQLVSRCRRGVLVAGNNFTVLSDFFLNSNVLCLHIV